jgi:hypothetical protein
MRVITKVKAAVRRARARVVDAEAVKCWECGERFPSDTKVYPFHQKMDGKKCPMSNKKVKGFEAEDAFPSPDKEHKFAPTGSYLGHPAQPNRCVHCGLSKADGPHSDGAKDTLTPIPVSGDREKDLAIAKHNAGVTRSQDRRVRDANADAYQEGAHVLYAGKPCIVIHMYADTVDLKTQEGYKLLGVKMSKLKPDYGKAKDASPVFNLSPVPMPEDEHDRGRLAQPQYPALDSADSNLEVYARQLAWGASDMNNKTAKVPTSMMKALRTAADMASDSTLKFYAKQAVYSARDIGDKWCRIGSPEIHALRRALVNSSKAEDEVTTKRQPNPNPNPRSITSLALPTPVDVSNAYQPRSATELKKSFGKDAAGGTYTMKEVNGKWVVYSADGKKICTYDDKAAAQHCVRLSMPNRIKSAKDAGPLTQKCVNCGMPIYKDMKYDVGQWKHGGTSQAHCSGGPGSSQFPELWPKKATPKAMAKDADGFKVGDKVMRGSDGPYKVVRVNENGSVEIQSIANYGHRQEPVSILSEKKAQHSLTKATDALRGLTPVGV